MASEEKDAFDILKSRVVERISEHFPVRGSKQSLFLDKVWVDDNLDKADIESQLLAKNNDDTWGVPVRGEMRLVDNKTGQVLSKQTVQLAKLPKMTSRYSFIIDGGEYQVDHLLRLKSGIYTRIASNGDMRSEFNLRKGGNKNFSIELNRGTKALEFVRKGTNAHIPVYPLMKVLGVADEDMERGWGKEVFEANRVQNPKAFEQTLAKFWKRTAEDGATAEPPPLEKLKEHAYDYFEHGELYPDITKVTLGQPFSRANGKALLAASTKLLNVSRGTEVPDDRDSLVFKEVAHVEDFIPEFMKRKEKWINHKIRQAVDVKKEVSQVLQGGEVFKAPIIEFFTKGGNVSERGEQTNPLTMLSGHFKTTTVAPDFGGIKHPENLKDDMRAINPSHFGFLDITHTPESERTGITLHLGTAVKKKGHDLTTPVFNLKNKKKEDLNVPKFYEAMVVLPDQVTWVKGKPRPVASVVKAKLPGGEIGTIAFKDANYVMPSTKGMFSFVTNSIPFLPSDQGNRVSMADKQIEQAISLKHREAPLVQSASSSKGTDTYERMLGGFTASKSPVAGQVTEVGPNGVKVKSGRSTISVPLYNYFPLNDPKAMLHSEPLVKPGDKVEKGQVVADSNFTKGGRLAIGSNLLVGYLPYRGYNFEDGIVISQSAAKKFTSEHLHTLPIEFEPEDKRNPNEWRAFNSKKVRDLSPEQLGLLDKDGVVKPGSRIKPGQVLVTALTPNYDEQDPNMVAAYKTRGMRLFKDKSLTWDEDVEGVVTRVVKAKSGRKVKVYVKTDESAVVGDKITGRHGDKGIITAILPDEEMPYVLDAQTQEKKPLQVLLNPLGVPTRMNVGQVLETAAGKIAEKTGKPYVVDNFGSPHNDYRAQVLNDLKQHGLSDEELVYDPKYPGRPLGSVLVGPKYLLKLKHQVEKKLSVRGGGTDLNNRPYGYTLDKQPEQGGARGGQGFGALESYSLLAHNARHNLREMATYKSDMQSEDFWDQIMRGVEPPPPKVPFSYEKFKGLMEGLAVDLRKEGTTLRLTPRTDKEILQLAGNGKNEIRDGTRLLLARAAPALRPEKGGLFDVHATGGLGGSKWSFIRMSEPMPNPLFVGSEQQRGPIPTLLNLRVEDIDAVMAGKKPLDGKVGGQAIFEALKKIDVEKELKATREAMPGKHGDALDRLNRKVKILQALKNEGQKPQEAYVLNYLPVIPPVFRPVTRTRSTIAQSSLNNLYRNFANLNQSLGSFNEFIPEATKNEVRQRLWNGFKALQAVGKFDPIYDPDDRARKREMSGILHIVGPAKGQQPKDSFFQANLIKRRQDLSLRSTVVPEPSLGLDQVGLPKGAAMELYKPFVVAKLRTEFGMEMPSALRAMQKSEPIAERALSSVLKERPLLLKRDPALHKFSVMAFEPVLTSGKAIKIHPLVTGGFNADFDGDCCLGNILLVSGDGTCYSSGQGEFVMPHTGSLASYQVVDIAQFPRVRESKIVKPSGVVEYDVPSQVYVPAYADGKMELRPVTKFSIHPGCEEWAVETKNGRSITCSEDHSLALLDPETLEVRKAPARAAVGLCAPTLRGLEGPGLYSVLPGHCVDHKNGRQMRDSVPLSFETGWFVGVCIGDGWVSPNHVSLASGVKDDAVRRYWSTLASWITNGSKVSDRHMPHLFDGKECESVKTVVSSTALSRFLEPLIGSDGARSKHLPTRFLEMPEVFRRGLFAGLIDTDGSANWSSRGQFALQFTTTSGRLCEEVMLLGLSLGLHSSKTEYENREAPAYVLTFSIRPVQEARWLTVLSVNKKKALEELWGGDQIAPGRNDFVPLPDRARKELLDLLRQIGASLRPPRRNGAAFSQYVVLKKNEPTLTRQSAQALAVLLLDLSKSEYLSKWFALALDPTVGWDLVTKAEFTGRHLEMYDITVPDSWTFTMADGLVVWDTMAGTVPISQQAVQEARKLFPSKNLFSPTNYNVMYTPGHESLLGLYQLSKWGKDAKVKVKDYETLRHLVEVGKVGHNDVVHVDALGPKPTTFGRLWMMHGVPRGFSLREQVLHDPNFVLSKKPLGQVTDKLAREFPQEFDKAVNHLKDLGNEFSYKSGFSFGLKDFAPLPERDRILSAAKKKADALSQSIKDPRRREQEIVNVYNKATEDIEHAAKNLVNSGNRLATMVYSGARGKPEQLRQMIAAPVLVQGHDNKAVLTPITRSYAEGLDIGDFWITQHGARKGTIQRTRGTSKPGELTKDIINSTISTMIVSEDCGTHQGVTMPIKNHKDIDTRDVVDRFLAHDVKLKDGSVAKSGTLVTPRLVDKLRQVDNVVSVRSPLKCQHGNGLCSKCYGLNENGKLHSVGTNIGVIAGQAMGEPATQLAMDAFHSGGLAAGRGGASGSRIERLQNLLRMTDKVKGQATLAKATGKVTSIRPNKAIGGHDVIIEGHAHRVDEINPDLKVGQMVQRGSSLSVPSAPVNPHHLLGITKDIHKVRNFLTKELHEGLYKSEGVRQRNVETVVRSLTNLTRVKDPGSSHWEMGDIVPYSAIEEHNRLGHGKEGHKPVAHEPVLRGSGEIPHLSQDWISRLNYRNIRSTIQQAAATGARADLHGTSPIPGIARGSEFGPYPKVPPGKKPYVY